MTFPDGTKTLYADLEIGDSALFPKLVSIDYTVSDGSAGILSNICSSTPGQTVEILDLATPAGTCMFTDPPETEDCIDPSDITFAPSLSLVPSPQPSVSDAPSQSVAPSLSLLPSTTSFPSLPPSTSQAPSIGTTIFAGLCMDVRPMPSEQPSSSIMPSLVPSESPSTSSLPSISNEPSASNIPSLSSFPSLSSNPSSSRCPSISSLPSLSASPSIATDRPSSSFRPSSSPSTVRGSKKGKGSCSENGSKGGKSTKSPSSTTQKSKKGDYDDENDTKALEDGDEALVAASASTITDGVPDFQSREGRLVILYSSIAALVVGVLSFYVGRMSISRSRQIPVTGFDNYSNERIGGTAGVYDVEGMKEGSRSRSSSSSDDINNDLMYDDHNDDDDLTATQKEASINNTDKSSASIHGNVQVESMPVQQPNESIEVKMDGDDGDDRWSFW